MTDYLNISLMKKVWRYLSKQIPDNKPDITKLNNIIEPLCCVIKLSILSYYPVGTKISIQNNTITFVKPNALQGPIRWSSGDKREDLHYLHNPLIKAAEWYQPLVKQNNEMTILFIHAIDGLKLLKKSYSSSSTIICHSLDSYCAILKKCLKNTDTPPISLKKNIFFKLKEDQQLKEVLAKVKSKSKIVTRSQKKIKEGLQNKQDNIKTSKSLTFSNTEIHINQDNSITSSLSTDEKDHKEENLGNRELDTNVQMKKTTVLGKQLKSMWTSEKIDIIINLFKELEKDKENKEYYISSITNLVNIVEKKVTNLLFNVRTFQDSGSI